ncbi:DNA polymerase III subunit beta [Candidatus Falkowbacteria bacterium]|nr:DNA polymerase III subunit beta [Candidatus Falkowbacteria bacterium]
MKFSCTQENLQQGLAIVSHIASKNVNLPILNNLLLRVEGGGVRFSATNLEIGVSCFVRGKIEAEGEFTVPARVFADYVSLLPKDKVDLLLKDNQLEISSASHQTKIKGQAAGDFPLIPQLGKKDPIVVAAVDFLSAISQVVFATALSETRPEISGVFFHFSAEDKKLTVAATDSYRLAEKQLTVTSGIHDKKAIIPAATLQEVQRILSSVARSRDKELVDGPTELEIYFNDNQVLFVFGTIELISRLIEGQYPDYAGILPGQHRTQMIVAVEDLAKAVKSAGLFVKSGINDVALEFKPEHELIVSTLNAQVGENVSHLEVNITGVDNAVTLNYRYLLDGLQALGTSEVVLEVVDNNTPVVLKPVLASAAEGISRDYLYLIMPIKQ